MEEDGYRPHRAYSCAGKEVANGMLASTRVLTYTKPMITEEIKQITEKIKEALDPERIYLFGSYARNEQTETSDYDFYVVVDEKSGNPILLSQKAYRAIRNNRTSAYHLFKTMYPKPLEIICFHCQQAAEKAIKALFVLKEIEVIKIHDLTILLKKIETFFLIPLSVKNASDDLTPFAATFRYPQYPDIDEDITRKALADMDTVIDWCKEQIKNNGNRY